MGLRRQRIWPGFSSGGRFLGRRFGWVGVISGSVRLGVGGRGWFTAKENRNSLQTSQTPVDTLLKDP